MRRSFGSHRMRYSRRRGSSLEVGIPASGVRLSWRLVKESSGRESGPDRISWGLNQLTLNALGRLKTAG